MGSEMCIRDSPPASFEFVDAALGVQSKGIRRNLETGCYFQSIFNTIDDFEPRINDAFQLSVTPQISLLLSAVPRER